MKHFYYSNEDHPLEANKATSENPANPRHEKSETSFLELNLRQVTIQKVKDIERIYAAKIFIDENFQNPLTIINLARHIGINDHKLKKDFKKLFKLTLFKYLQKVRMTHALQLLETGTPLKEISHLVGYSNIPNFSNAFKFYYGFTASEYRRIYCQRFTH